MYYSNPKIEICQCETIAIRIGMIISFDGGPSTSDGGTPSLHWESTSAGGTPAEHPSPQAGRKRDSRYASLYQPRKVKSSSSCSSSFMRFKTAGEHSVAARSK